MPINLKFKSNVLNGHFSTNNAIAIFADFQMVSI